MTNREMKILIVDDNPEMREMMRQFLPASIEEIRYCSDGLAALSAYSKFVPDLVLMDWQMKQMDGLTATREIIKNFPDANVLIVTQYDDAELKEAAAQAGASGFVLKDELSVLRRIISASKKNSVKRGIENEKL